MVHLIYTYIQPSLLSAATTSRRFISPSNFFFISVRVATRTPQHHTWSWVHALRSHTCFICDLREVEHRTAPHTHTLKFLGVVLSQLALVDACVPLLPLLQFIWVQRRPDRAGFGGQ